MVTGLAALIKTGDAEAYTCLTPSSANPSITVSGTTATANFTLPKGCKNIDVSLVSYKAPNGTDGKPFDQQVLYKSVTRNYNIEGRREIKVEVPNCYYQVDLVIGQPLHSFAGGVTYHAQHRFLLAKQGGTTSCTPAVTPTPPPATPATSTPSAVSITNTNTNTNTVSPAAKSPVPTPAPAPTPEPVPDKEPSGKLPDTGPGTIAAFSFGSTFMGSLLMAYRNRFTGLVDRIATRF